MKVRITDELAQQIVDSAKVVVGWDVNFIDCHGQIMASTDDKPATPPPGPVRSRPYRMTGRQMVSVRASIIQSSWMDWYWV